MNTIKTQFCQLKTRKDVANLLGIKESSLRYFLYKKRPENMYKDFKISKKDGTLRTISAPQKELKTIQRKLAEILYEVYQPKTCTYGFVKDKSIVDNAHNHIKRKLVLNIDLKDFFGQIHFGRVRGMLMSPPYSIGEEAATTIAQIVCYRGKLPQGAPTSPIITNMVCVPLDNALIRVAKSTGCIYTRYADDITFSTYKNEFNKEIIYKDDNGIHLGDTLVKVLNKHSFTVNPQKVTLKSRYERQEVTGLTVNQFPNVRRSYLKELRAIIHSCEEYGVYSGAKFYIKKGLCKNKNIITLVEDPDHKEAVVNWFKKVLVGKVNYIKQVRGEENLTFLYYAQKLNTMFNEAIFDLTHLHKLEKLIRDNVYVLHYEDGEDYIQGSGFFLKDYGVITSYHVTESDHPFDVIVLSKNQPQILRNACTFMNCISSDVDIDYAVYNIKQPLEQQPLFTVGNSKQLHIGDQVIIAGYPNYNSGDSPFIQTCTITSQKQYMGAPFFTVSGRIVHGASGGVVLNANYEVIGVIKGGVASMSDEDTTENHGFVPIHLISDHMNI